MNKKLVFIVILLLTILGVLMRLMPHPANFSPLIAISLFSGYYLPKKYALVLPLGIMFLTDLFLGFYELPVMLAVYSCFFVSILAGNYLRKRINVINLITTTLFLSLLFFITTNFVVWYFTPWYSHSLSGLALCFTYAIPFFRNSLMGNFFFVTTIFSCWELVKLSNRNILVQFKEDWFKI